MSRSVPDVLGSHRTRAASGLLDLPPEVQMMIYRQAGFPFEARDMRDIRLSIYRPRGRPSRVVHSNFRDAALHPLSQHEEKIKQIRRNRSGIGVLSSCRQIHAETTKLLYSKAVFSFLSMAILGKFLRTIGYARRHLRHVVVDGYFDQGMGKGVLHLLEEAETLRSFELSFEMAEWDVNAMALLFADLIAQLRASSQERQQRRSAMEVLRFSHYHSGWRDSERPAACPICPKAKQVQAEVRRTLQLLLSA